MKKGAVLFLALLLFFIWLFFVNPHDLFLSLKKGNLLLALSGTLLGFGGLFFKALRLHIALQKIKTVPPLRSFSLFFSGFSLDYFFSLFGIVSQLGIFWWAEQIPAATTAALMVLLRIIDYLIIFPFLLFFFSQPSIFPDLLIKWAKIGLLLILGIILLLCLTAFFLPPLKRSSLRLKDHVLRFFQVFPPLLQARTLFLLLGCTLFEYTLEAIGIWVLLKAFSLPIRFAVVFGFHLLIQFFYLVPNVPGELGTHEWIVQGVFASILGFDKAKIAAANIFSHFFNASYLFLAGTASLAILGLSRATLKQLAQNGKSSSAAKDQAENQ